MVPPNKVGAVIGEKGSTVKKMVEETGAQIEIEKEGIPGQIVVYAADQAVLKDVEDRILALTVSPEVGKVYKESTVKSVKDFGLFIEFLPGQEGLVHISEISKDNKFMKVEEVDIEVGEKVDARLIEVRTKRPALFDEANSMHTHSLLNYISRD